MVETLLLILVTAAAQILDPFRLVLLGLAGYFAKSKAAAAFLGALASLLIFGIMRAILETRGSAWIPAISALLLGLAIPPLIYSIGHRTKTPKAP